MAESSDSIAMCLSSSIAILHSSAVMHSGMCVHEPIALMVMHMPGISSSPVSWLCLDSHSTMDSCGPGLYSILMLYWDILNSILCENDLSHRVCLVLHVLCCYSGLPHLLKISLVNVIAATLHSQEVHPLGTTFYTPLPEDCL